MFFLTKPFIELVCNLFTAMIIVTFSNKIHTIYHTKYVQNNTFRPNKIHTRNNSTTADTIIVLATFPVFLEIKAIIFALKIAIPIVMAAYILNLPVL